MTTLVATQQNIPRPSVPDTAQLGFARVLRSEWIKIRSVRSTVWSYAALVLMSIGMAVLMPLTLSLQGGTVPAEQQVSLMMQVSTFGVFFGQLIVGVLGVLVMTGEYRTGMIRSTLTAVPKRLPALWAKAIVTFVTTYAVSLVATVGSYLVASPIMASKGVSAAITEPEIMRGIFAGALYLSLVAVFALMVGTIVRSSAAGISIVLGILLVLPTVLQVIPAQWARDVGPYLFSDAGLNFVGLQSFSLAPLEPWQQLAIVLGWLVVSTAGAAALLIRRDA